MYKNVITSLARLGLRAGQRSLFKSSSCYFSQTLAESHANGHDRLQLKSNDIGIYSFAVRYQGNTAAKKPAKERIEEMIKNSDRRVFLFMKGVPEQPACGYSNAVVQILNAYDVPFDSFNVLEDDEIRQEIKVYSNWPTIPQLYVDKSFVGGCDILIQMHENDELEKLFEAPKC